VKRLGVVLVVLLVVFAAFGLPATGQDNYEERIASLETRMAVLESTPVGTVSTAVTITGTLTYRDRTGGAFVPVGGNCAVEGDGGLFLADTLPVTVTNEFGETVGESELGVGVPDPNTPSFEGVTSCTFPFVVENVTASFAYTISVGFGGLPPTTVSAAELERAGFTVDVAAGDPA
jgi:hypothetical protein